MMRLPMTFPGLNGKIMACEAVDRIFPAAYAEAGMKNFGHWDEPRKMAWNHKDASYPLVN